MKDVFIKHNPYKLETEVNIDGNELASNSVIGERKNDRLQEWVEELPDLLLEENNSKSFKIRFHGTLMDKEDVEESFKKAQDEEKLEYELEWIPAKETSDKEVLIDPIFERIQEGPFDELKDKKVVDAFQKAKSGEVEVIVAATVSSGKSTLINAMLAEKMMPTKQEACTAIITKIKDNNNLQGRWKARVYDEKKELSRNYEKLTLEDMEELNMDGRVREIHMEGNIPFLSAEDMSLVLVDTLGPNNARNEEHGEIQKSFLDESSKSLVLYIMPGNFGTNDDNVLLRHISDSMKVGGKQSKDRYIFVLNKIDDRDEEDGEIGDTLNKLRDYLKTFGIERPNIFPAAALPGLNMRLLNKGKEIGERTKLRTESNVKEFNAFADFHCEKYASLPLSIKDRINKDLERAREEGNKIQEAIIHTGIPSIEAAIRQYVEKYSKTAKIKNIADTFTGKLEETKSFEKTKEKLFEAEKDAKTIGEMLAKISNNLEDAELARKFEEAVDQELEKVKKDSKEAVDLITKKYQAEIRKKTDENKSKEIEMEAVGNEVKKLEAFARELEPEFKLELDRIIRQNLVKTSNALLEEYRKKIESLTEDIDQDKLMGVEIKPLDFIEGSLKYNEKNIMELRQTKSVEDGEEYVVNTDKKWYKVWTWFQEDGYYRTKYKNVDYIPATELAENFFSIVSENLTINANAALGYAKGESDKITQNFKGKFKELDNIIEEKMAILEEIVSDKEEADEKIEGIKENLDWLEAINKEIESILEI